MFQLFSELSRATDFFNSVRDEEEHIEYFEVLETLKNRHDEKEVMELIISLYSRSH